MTVDDIDIISPQCHRNSNIGDLHWASTLALGSAWMFEVPPYVRPRRLWLRRALRGYPLYDPPHKVEERLLPREQAVENFDYFMRVREERVAYFKNWLHRNFWTVVTLDETGVRALNTWGNRFAGFLLTADANARVTDSFFTYDPPWTGEAAVYNVLFDMGITLGEVIIANCPKLHWGVDPASAVLPRTARMLKKSQGMSFQRPELTGFENPGVTVHPLHGVHGFARQMLLYATTWSGHERYWRCARHVRRNIRWELLNTFSAVLRDYHTPFVDPLREQMTAQEYLTLVDKMESGEEG
jgi:hypothetical protein